MFIKATPYYTDIDIPVTEKKVFYRKGYFDRILLLYAIILPVNQ